MIDHKSELEQSILRVILVCGFFIYTLIVEYILTNEVGTAYPAIAIGLIYSIASLFLYFNIKRYSGYYFMRRIIGIVSDISAISFSMLYLGEYGVPVFAAYPWIIIGNGFRYGIKYLIFCSILSAAGFIFIATNNIYWTDSYTLLWAGLIILTVVPVYVAVLLGRLENEKIKAEMANKEKSRFLANISHEIRTPLNVVVGFSDMLDKQDGEINKNRLVKGIRDSANSLLALVDGVLDFSRIESGHISLEHKPVNLKDLTSSLNGMFSLQAESKGISLTCWIAPDVPPVIAGDISRLRQILINLVGNAIKFTHKGKVELLVDTAQQRLGKRYIRFTIADTGIGIKDEMIPVIFDRFRQADDTAQRQYGGTGLGTAIAKHLVELMGGAIGLDSRYGKGSRFWFTLPCVLPADNGLTHDSESQHKLGPLLLDAGMQYRVLVVDDSEINRQVIKGMLDWMGVETVFAESGTVALDRLRRERLNLVILDIQMPVMSGLDVIRKYHQTTGIPDRIPVVIVTGDATVDIQEECRRLGVKEFLAKPVELEKLHHIISGYVCLQMNKTASG